jgi:hypothetical protein
MLFIWEGIGMSVLNAIRKQENPDGVKGHEERLLIQEESRNNPPKKVFTRGQDFHHYNRFDLKRQWGINKERLLQAKEYCKTLCCNYDCPLRGI